MSALQFPLPPNRGSISSRLERALGLGTDPSLRRALYQKLQSLCESDRGSEILECIDACVSDAQGKQDPGRYFAYVVCRRLQERGLMVDRPRVDW